MKNTIYSIKCGDYKSMLVLDDEMWFTSGSPNDMDGFEKAVKSPGLLTKSESIKYININSLSYNESDNFVKLDYTNEKGKNDKAAIDFGDTDRSKTFGDFLGKSLNMQSVSTKEGLFSSIGQYAIILVIAAAGTVYLGTMEDPAIFDEENGLRKSKRNAALINMILETLGTTGVWIVGSLIVLFCAYQIFKKYNNPANIISYSR